jgi:hypothetical protein
MKPALIFCLLFFVSVAAFAQTEFIGIIKYKMTVVGGDEQHPDSMQIVFDKSRLMISLYMPDQEKPGGKYLFSMIEDFAAKREYILDEPTKSYKNDSMLVQTTLHFIDTKKMGLIKGFTCFYYKADSSTIDSSKITNAECMASIDHTKKDINNFMFMSMQPVIVDNRIVLDFLATEPDGTQPRIFVSELIAKTNVEEYFDLSKYKEVK